MVMQDRNPKVVIHLPDWMLNRFFVAILAVIVISSMVWLTLPATTRENIANSVISKTITDASAPVIKFTLSGGNIYPESAIIAAGTVACVELDASKEKNFKEWNFGENQGHNPSPLSGFCTVPWMNSPGDEIKITGETTGGESTTTIRFR